MSSPNWVARKGSNFDETVTILDSAGVAVTGVYSGSETLELLLWAGEDQAPLALTTSAASWVSAPAGTLRISIDPADTESADTGWYRVLVRATSGSDVLDLIEGLLRLDPEPGEAAALSVYCSYDDVRRAAFWVDQLPDDDPSMLANFAEQRHEARVWLDRQLIARAREKLEAYAAGYLEPEGGDPIVGDDTELTEQGIIDRLDELQAHLDANRLRTSDGAAKEIATAWTIWLIGRPQVGTDRNDTAYQRQAIAFRNAAAHRLASVVFYLDVQDADSRLVVLGP